MSLPRFMMNMETGTIIFKIILSTLQDIDHKSQSTHFALLENYYLVKKVTVEVCRLSNVRIWKHVDMEILRLYQVRKRQRIISLRCSHYKRIMWKRLVSFWRLLKMRKREFGCIGNMVEASWSQKLEPKWEGYLSDT